MTLDFLDTWDIIITVACLIFGILLLIGKGDFLVNDKNGTQRNKLYDMDKAKKGFGVMLLLMAAVTVVNSLIDSLVMDILYIFIIILLLIGGYAYMRYACKRSK